MNVAVCGLGLIGGSLARALARAGHEVMGYDRSATTLRAARRAGVVRTVFGPDGGGAEAVDVFVIAVPVDQALCVIDRVADALARVPLVTDVGSTKRSIVAHALRTPVATAFVGGHPLAGDHRSGWGAARADLFAGATAYLTPSRRSSARARTLARRLWRAAGAHPRILPAAAHDRLMAAVSHAPQVTASSLATALAAAGVPARRMGRGGRDTSRVAASDPAAWTAILLDNRDAVDPVLGRVERALRDVRRAIARGDGDAVREWLVRAARWRRRADRASGC